MVKEVPKLFRAIIPNSRCIQKDNVGFVLKLKAVITFAAPREVVYMPSFFKWIKSTDEDDVTLL